MIKIKLGDGLESIQGTTQIGRSGFLVWVKGVPLRPDVPGEEEAEKAQSSFEGLITPWGQRWGKEGQEIGPAGGPEDPGWEVFYQLLSDLGQATFFFLSLSFLTCQMERVMISLPSFQVNEKIQSDGSKCFVHHKIQTGFSLQWETLETTHKPPKKGDWKQRHVKNHLREHYVIIKMLWNNS